MSLFSNSSPVISPSFESKCRDIVYMQKQKKEEENDREKQTRTYYLEYGREHMLRKPAKNRCESQCTDFYLRNHYILQMCLK